VKSKLAAGKKKTLSLAAERTKLQPDSIKVPGTFRPKNRRTTQKKKGEPGCAQTYTSILLKLKRGGKNSTF